MISEERLKNTLGLHVTTALLILVPVALIAFLVSIHRGEVRHVAGTYLETAARTAALRIDQSLIHLQADVRAIAGAPALVGEAKAAGRRSFDQSTVDRIDALWIADGAPPVTLRPNPLETPLSVYLKNLVRDHGIYHELIAADSRGRLFAASGVTTDYDQDGEDWFLGATTRCDGAPSSCTSVVDMGPDESSATSGFEISTPIPDTTGETLGVLKAVVDPMDVVAILDAVESAGFVEAYLLDTAGNVILSGTKRSFVGGQEFFAADSVRRKAGYEPPDTTSDEAGPVVIRPHEFNFIREHPDGTQRLVGASVGRIPSGRAAWVVAVVEPDTLVRGYMGATMWYVTAIIGLFGFLVFLLSSLAVHRTRSQIEASSGGGDAAAS